MNRNRFPMTWAGLTLLALVVSAPAAAVEPTSWSNAKNLADDEVYFDRSETGYCNCTFVSDGDSDGSGDITDTSNCGFTPGDKWERNTEWIEWEHVVPASLMPARQRACWADDGSRKRCIKNDPTARAMLLDLHNLVPSIGQVNQYRGHKRYGEIPGDQRGRIFGGCPVQVAGDHFEPPDCRKGDVARIWFYMVRTYGVRVPDSEMAMLKRWAEQDPVSPWEHTRAQRIHSLTGRENPYVERVTPDPAGACDA